MYSHLHCLVWSRWCRPFQMVWKPTISGAKQTAGPRASPKRGVSRWSRFASKWTMVRSGWCVKVTALWFEPVLNHVIVYLAYVTTVSRLSLFSTIIKQSFHTCGFVVKSWDSCRSCNEKRNCTKLKRWILFWATPKTANERTFPVWIGPKGKVYFSCCMRLRSCFKCILTCLKVNKGTIS